MSTLTDQFGDTADFLRTIWGEEDLGFYVIVVAQENPHLAAEGGDRWHDFGFRWPKGFAGVMKRIATAEASGANVYICPALYNRPIRETVEVAGSFCLWMDSDGNAPTTFDAEVPEPSIRVRTSSPTNIHDYWMLNDFLSDVDALETGNRSIAHYYDADQSGWDAIQLLRPPGTTNRKNGLPVTLLTDLS